MHDWAVLTFEDACVAMMDICPSLSRIAGRGKDILEECATTRRLASDEE